MTQFNYPTVERDDSQVEESFGVQVPDPYRYLEDSSAEKTKQFVGEQIKITEPYLENCPYRSRIKELLTINQDYEKYSCPFKRGSKYYFFKNSGLQAQSVMYQQDTLESEPKVFFDPNALSADGTVSLTTFSFSPDHKYFAYGLSYSGSDWMELKVKIVDSGEDLLDKLVKVKSTGIEWTHDNKGFFYAQYPSHTGLGEGTETSANMQHCLFYHLLYTEQSKDVLKVNFPDNPTYLVSAEVSNDGRYLFIYAYKGCNSNIWFYFDLENFDPQASDLSIKPLCLEMEAEFEYITNFGSDVYFRTNLHAKNYRVVKLSLDNPAENNWVDVVPEHERNVLEWAEVYQVNGINYILLNYQRNAVYYLELHELEGALVKKFETPMGTISKSSGRRNDNEFFFHFTSFLTPSQIFHFDLTKLDEEPRLILQSLPKSFNPDEYVIKQIFYESSDATQVPMFIVHHKDIKLDGTNPCILYGYGGFNILLTSSFNVNRLMWLKNFKGVFAIANIRGGGEMGQSWHHAGRLLNKQNCFNDFISAAEYLVNSKYTNRNKLAIEGGSNGGLLVAAVSNQRPDLIGASLCHVGVLDMIRFPLFTVGHCWTTEYGDPNEKEHFDNLIKYSPYHNIPDHVERYPATLLLTADHDDRVVPGHSYKFIAQLQYKLGTKLPDTPLLIRIQQKAGHGRGSSIFKVINQYTDIYSFLYNALDLESVLNLDK